MSIAEGHFRLYSRVTPALKAGLYRFTAHQDLAADGPDGALAAAALPVEDLGLHVDVTSPRYVLPPDQVLSTYPPAGTRGAYGARLPQVVSKARRTSSPVCRRRSASRPIASSPARRRSRRARPWRSASR
jgi:hypothetical protein